MEQEKDGFSRRDLLKRSAIIGGAVVWSAPVIQSVTSPVFAAGTEIDTGGGGGSTPPNDGHTGGISYVILLIECAGVYYLGKFNGSEYTTTPAYGSAVDASGPPKILDNTCRNGLAALKGYKPAGSSTAITIAESAFPASVYAGTSATADFSLTLDADCTLIGYVVHDGQLNSSTNPQMCYYQLGDGQHGGSLSVGGSQIISVAPGSLPATGVVTFDKLT